MSVSKKGLRKIIRNNREFYWCVKKDDDDSDRLYLVIKSDDKQFSVSYLLKQKDKELAFSPQNSFIIVKGKEFKGLDNLGGCWQRFLVPEWEDEIVSPSLVAKIIDWCFICENVTSVNYRGELMSEAELKFDRDFCEYFEYEISHFLEKGNSKRSKKIWCDGIIFETMIDDKIALFSAWIGDLENSKGGQKKYDLFLHLGKISSETFSKGLNIKSCVSQINPIHDFSVNVIKEQIELKLM